MALQALQLLGDGLAAQTFQAAAGGGDSCNYVDRGFIEFLNGSGGIITVTFTLPTTIHGQTVALAVAVPAAVASVPGVRKVKMTPDMAAGNTGVVSWTYSGVTSLTVAVMQS